MKTISVTTPGVLRQWTQTSEVPSPRCGDSVAPAIKERQRGEGEGRGERDETTASALDSVSDPERNQGSAGVQARISNRSPLPSPSPRHATALRLGATGGDGEREPR